jgi:DNA end-binding protein Ku
MWRGAISFGLVTIAVRLYKATETHDFEFHQVHREDSGRIRYQRICELDGEEVPYEEVAKGYELDDGRMVVLDDEDLEKLPITTDKAIEVVEFVPAAQVDPIFYDRTYYLEPDKTSVRSYVLFHRALAESDRVAIVKVALRQRETLALLRARDELLVLHNMLWPDEIRDPAFEFLDQRTQVRKQELEMARSLVDSMAGDFDPDQFDDDYRDAMRQLIEAKAEGAELPKRPEPKREEAVDLMTALQQSVEAAKSSHRGSATKSGSTKPASPKSGSTKPASAKSASPKSGSTKSASPKSASAKSGSTESASSKSASAKSGSSRRKRGNSNKRSA